MKSLSELNIEPGKGKGYGYPPRRGGGTDLCICPKCKTTAPHIRGKPCNELKCPKCGIPMQGK